MTPTERATLRELLAKVADTPWHGTSLIVALAILRRFCLPDPEQPKARE